MLGRLASSFDPARVPLMSRANYVRELRYTLLFSTVLAIVEGGVIGVIARNAFDGVVPRTPLNFVVGLMMAAPEFANISSFLWTALAHGKHKVRFINRLQLATIVLTLLIAAVPRSELGLYAMGALVVAARVCIGGVVTLRASIWRANYTRMHRARATGKFSTVSVLVIAACGLFIGKAMDLWDQSFRVLIPMCAIAGALAAASYARVRVRGHGQLLAAELADPAARPSFNPLAMLKVLRADRAYDAFMTSLFLIGTGNLMLSAPLVITLKERFGVEYLGGIAVINTIPSLVVPWFIPVWARLLARVHVVRFRSIHSWVFVLAQIMVLLAVVTRTFWLLYLSSALLGVAYGGGTLAWNLGHLDFAPGPRAALYMGVHVTLNGVRGLIAPLLAVSIYEWLESRGEGQGAWVFAFSIVLCVAGAMGFVVLSRVMGERARTAPRET
ncbi:MAG: MFS transporter [Phycisphaerales bacterium]